MSTRCPTDIDRFVGQRIRLARRIAKMSQQKLGEQIGVTYQQIQKYENGTDRIGAGRLHQVSLSTEQPIEFFFSFGEEVEAKQSDRQDILADDGVQRLIVSASKIRSRKLLDNLAQIAETFATAEVAEAPKA
ncbi:helix-turn-helix domain-containing protein [Salinarimonas sp. NSM]|uniref:helix-turn-helix domain-containing protein n=1 Tax=Salinarimonas sp. NSM TaxID=3458003 RepID=UPI0040354757